MHDGRSGGGPPRRGGPEGRQPADRPGQGPRPGGRRPPPPDETGAEDEYLWSLRNGQTPVKVRLSTGVDVIGTVTYFDRDMVKIEAIEGPSLFVRKTDIRYLSEVGG